MTTTIIARLTVTRQDNTCTIVEIHSDATFHGFYHFFKQQGRRRSTKHEFRTASRNESLPVINTHLHTPGLHVIEKRLKDFGAQSNPVISSKLRIIKKRAYQRLITVSPSELGLSRIGTVDLSHRQRIPLPSSLVPAKRRYSVLNGWSR